MCKVKVSSWGVSYSFIRSGGGRGSRKYVVCLGFKFVFVDFDVLELDLFRM